MNVFVKMVLLAKTVMVYNYIKIVFINKKSSQSDLLFH